MGLWINNELDKTHVHRNYDDSVRTFSERLERGVGCTSLFLRSWACREVPLTHSRGSDLTKDSLGRRRESMRTRGEVRTTPASEGLCWTGSRANEE